MLVFIPAIGSLGDVLPYVALAERLVKLGHRVRLGTHEHYKHVSKSEFEWVLLSGDLERTLTSTPEGREMQKNPSVFNTSLIKTVFGPLVTAWFDDLMKYSEGADLIVMGQVAWLAGFSCLEKYPDLKAVVIFTFPSTPTWDFAPPTLPGTSESWFRWMNGLKWTMADKGAQFIYGDLINAQRAAFGLPALTENFREHFAKLRTPHPITLTAYSTHLLPRPSDWPDHTDMTPPLLVDPDANNNRYDAPKDLKDFLEPSKPKPIYIGVGSMMNLMLERPQQVELVRNWLTGLRYAKTRAIISLSGMDANDQENFKSNESVYFVNSFIPHHWLFPQLAGVVHHGGAGTTQTGLYYGLPTLVLPFGADQPFNGDRVYLKKLGPKPIPIKEVTAKKFAEAVKELVGTAAVFKENAAKVAELMQHEDGVGTAAKVIEDVLAGKHVKYPVQVVTK